MTEQVPSDPVMSHAKLHILELLADNGGRLSHSELLVDGRAKSSRVTRPMVRAEWIGAEFADGDWWFWITDAGRVMLEAYK